MRARRLSGRLIGLVAAYLVALQALLLPLSMPPTAAFAGAPGMLCLTGPSADPAQHPADHDQGCPCGAGCGMQCHAPALAAAPPAGLAAPPSQVSAVSHPALRDVAPHRSVRVAQMPRGPPIS